MKNLVVLLEEASAREMLKGFLTNIIPEQIHIRYIVFQGKQDLEKQIVRKLRGWLEPETCFLILRDQDSADCIQVKQNLAQLCREGGKPNTMVRIACRELESWYFGDLEAVEKGLGLDHISQSKNKAKFRNPDSIVHPASELMRLTNYKYQKISGSRAIGPYLDQNRNTSHSFNVFVSGVKRLIKDCGGLMP